MGYIPHKKTMAHGLSGTKLYRIWADMLQRCKNPKSTNYKYYGARGIRVCEEWKVFINFYNWAMSAGYEKGLSIDRIDVNGNYEPNNCRWVTREQQDNNRRDSIKELINGEELTLAQIARKYKVSYAMVLHRYRVGDRGSKLIEPKKQGIKRDGTEIQRLPTKLTYEKAAEIKWLGLNKKMTQKEIASRYGVTQVMVSAIKLERVYKGLEPVMPDWWRKHG